MRNLHGPVDILLRLRDIDVGEETATATETAIDFVAAEAGDFKALIAVSALDFTTENETYVISIMADADSGFGSPVEVGKVTVTEIGTYEIPLSGPAIEHIEPGTIKLAAKATLGGTTPSITYGAHITSGAG